MNKKKKKKTFSMKDGRIVDLSVKGRLTDDVCNPFALRDKCRKCGTEFDDTMGIGECGNCFYG